MKRLLPFFQHKQPQRPKEPSHIRHGVRLPGIYGSMKTLFAKEYVPLTTKIFPANIHIPLYPDLLEYGKGDFEKQGIQGNTCMRYSWTFLVDNQPLTIEDARGCPLSFFTTTSSVALSFYHHSSQMNSPCKFSFNRQAYEHFDRLSSLIEHAQQSHLAKRGRSGQGFILNIGISNPSIKIKNIDYEYKKALF